MSVFFYLSYGSTDRIYMQSRQGGKVVLWSVSLLRYAEVSRGLEMRSESEIRKKLDELRQDYRLCSTDRVLLLEWVLEERDEG